MNTVDYEKIDFNAGSLEDLLGKQVTITNSNWSDFDDFAISVLDNKYVYTSNNYGHNRPANFSQIVDIIYYNDTSYNDCVSAEIIGTCYYGENNDIVLFAGGDYQFTTDQEVIKKLMADAIALNNEIIDHHTKSNEAMKQYMELI